eukprot:9345904-Alexandrium_andersonii.AAC.1
MACSALGTARAGDTAATVLPCALSIASRTTPTATSAAAIAAQSWATSPNLAASNAAPAVRGIARAAE